MVANHLRGSHVHAGRGAFQKPPLEECSQNEATCGAVERPESSCLGFRQLQTRHLFILALDSPNCRRHSLRSRLRCLSVIKCLSRHDPQRGNRWSNDVLGAVGQNSLN